MNYRVFTKKNSPIIIGRGTEASIRLISNSLSRIHCRLESIKNKWHIIDGDGKKRSTNGTWLYADDPFPIHDGMVFKAGLLLMKAYLNP